MPPRGAVNDLSPRVRKAYLAVADEIDRGILVPGEKLPSNTQLANSLGVSPVTMLRVLNELQKAGLVSVEHGRGTFVRGPTGPSVLIVDDQAVDRLVLQSHMQRLGCRAVEATGPAEGLEILSRESSIRLVLSDVRMPQPEDGVGFIVAVRRNWPKIDVVAVTAHPGDLDGLQGQPECPILVMSKPVRSQHVEDALRLVLER
jgi:CheY-like chemotaxis protein